MLRKLATRQIHVSQTQEVYTHNTQEVALHFPGEKLYQRASVSSLVISALN